MAWIDYKKANDMVPHSWIEDCLKMYKVSNKVIKFVTKAMKKKKKKSEINSRMKNFSRGENPERLFPGRCAFALPICNSNDATRLLKKCIGTINLQNYKKKMYHLMKMDDIKLFTKHEKELNSDINNRNT